MRVQTSIFLVSLFLVFASFGAVVKPKPFAPAQRDALLFEAENCEKLDGDAWRVIRFKQADKSLAYPSGGGLLEAAAADVKPAVGLVSKRPAGGKYRVWVRFALPQQTDVTVDPCSVAFRQKGKTFPAVSFDVPSSFLSEELRTAKDLYAWRQYGIIDVAAGEPLSVVFSQESSDAFDSVCASFDCVYLTKDLANERPPDDSVVPANLYLRFIVAKDGVPMYMHAHGRDTTWKKWLKFTVGTGMRKVYDQVIAGATKPGATSDWANATMLSDFSDVDFLVQIRPGLDNGVKIGEGGSLHFRMQMASSPSEKDIFFDHEFKDTRRLFAVGGIFNPVKRTYTPDFAFAQDVADKLASLPPVRGKAAVRFPIATAVHAHPFSEEVKARELKNVREMGFNSFGLGTPIPYFVEYGPTNGFLYLDGQQFWGEFEVLKKDADGFERHDREASDQKAAAFAKMLRDNKINLPFSSLADEPGMGFDDLFQNPKALHDFPAWLEEQGVTAEELGIASLAEAKPARYEDAPSGAMHYWSMKYFTKVFGDRFRGSTRAAATQGIRTGVNLACQVAGNILWSGSDWYELYREGGLSYGWCEDWFNMCETYQFCGFQMAVMRSACEPVGVPYGTYCIIAGRPPWDIGSKAFAQFARKLDSFKMFNYGPQYNCGDSFNLREPALFQEIRDVNFAMGAVEDTYIASEPLRGDTALLYSTTSDYWNSRSVDWFPASLYGVERSTLYLLLGQCGVRADVLYEGDFGRFLKDYKSLFATDSHIHSRNLPALIDWVKGGGVLYLSANALAYDEYNRPTKLEEKLGFRRGAFRQVGKFEGTIACQPMPEPIETIPGFGDAIPVLYATQPVEGQALASLADGTPAVTEIASGKGKVILCGFLPGLSHFKRAKHDPDHVSLSYSAYPENTRALMRSILRSMSVVPAVASDHPMVEAHLLVGPDRDLLVLSNWSAKPQKVTVTLRHGVRYRSVRAIRNDGATLSTSKNLSTVTLTVGPGDFVELLK